MKNVRLGSWAALSLFALLGSKMKLKGGTQHAQTCSLSEYEIFTLTSSNEAASENVGFFTREAPETQNKCYEEELGLHVELHKQP
jgi:hypothetical protein